jgi:uncharacterized 2Fe-2S/4Fe-4S cluster protein (DUF4445 family)
MKKEITVKFESLGIRISTKPGKTIFEIAKDNGLAIRSECGRRGVCGKCKIIIHNMKVVSELTENEEKHLAKKEVP